MSQKNYITTIAEQVYRHGSTDDEAISVVDMDLYRGYAVLVLAKGEHTTAEDVHNAWSAWASVYRRWSTNIIPFSELTPEVQAMDDEYVEAIRAVARRLNPTASGEQPHGEAGGE